MAELYRAQGVPGEHARAEARLGLAVVRGLLLDLLATRDREGGDELVALVDVAGELVRTGSPAGDRPAIRARRA
ncbi:MAG: hypothetical protein ACRDK0_15785 [Solirubrobacteraceae bacterium]